MRDLIKVLSCVCVMILGASGCGEDNSRYEGGITEVVEIDSEDSTIPLGDGSVVRVNFAFDQNEVFSDDGEVTLVLKFPRQLSYRNNSAEIDKSGSRDRDVDPRVRRCPSGDTYLVFTLGESELEDAAPPVDAGDAQLKLTLDGEQRGEMVSIEGAADENVVPFSCTTDFEFDEQEIVNVR
jgi:hypothetical protein